MVIVEKAAFISDKQLVYNCALPNVTCCLFYVIYYSICPVSACNLSNALPQCRCHGNGSIFDRLTDPTGEVSTLWLISFTSDRTPCSNDVKLI